MNVGLIKHRSSLIPFLCCDWFVHWAGWHTRIQMFLIQLGLCDLHSVFHSYSLLYLWLTKSSVHISRPSWCAPVWTSCFWNKALSQLVLILSHDCSWLVMYQKFLYFWFPEGESAHDNRRNSQHRGHSSTDEARRYKDLFLEIRIGWMGWLWIRK